MHDENSNVTAAASATLVALNAAAATSSAGTASVGPPPVPGNSAHIYSQLMNSRDSRWLQLEVCREFQRGQCSRSDVECKFAHPPSHVDVQNGRVTACYDSIKGRCSRENPKCKYLHPPQHLKDQLLTVGKQHLAAKNLLCSQLQGNTPNMAPAIQVGQLAQLVQQQQQHPALVQALPYQYYSPLIYPALLAQAQGDPYGVQTPTSAATLAAQQQLALLQIQQQQQQQSVVPNPMLTAQLLQQHHQQQQQLAAMYSPGLLDSRKRSYRTAALESDPAASTAASSSAGPSAAMPGSSTTVQTSGQMAQQSAPDAATIAAIQQQFLLAAAANGGPVPMKRPAPDKNAANIALYHQQQAAATPTFNPYLIPGYVPAVSCPYFM